MSHSQNDLQAAGLNVESPEVAGSEVAGLEVTGSEVAGLEAAGSEADVLNTTDLNVETSTAQSSDVVFNDAQKPRDESSKIGETLLSVDNIVMRFGGVIAVNELSMNIRSNSIVGLIGPNGAGKTTAFNVISGFYAPQEGRVSFAGQDITAKSPHLVCQAGIARTFQNIRLSQHLTAVENVMVGCHVRRKYPWWMAPLSLPMFNAEEDRIRETTMQLIEKLELTAYAHEKAHSLPYGAQRRLEIARALATQPRFLLLDEPAAGMNPQESLDLMRFIAHIRDEFELTILLIEHDMKVVMGVCQYIWVMEYGRLIAEGLPEEIRNNPEVIKAYLGTEMPQ